MLPCLQQIGRLCVALYEDCVKKNDFSGLSRMVKKAPHLVQAVVKEAKNEREEGDASDGEEKKEEGGEARDSEGLGIEELKKLNLLQAVSEGGEEGGGEVEDEGKPAKEEPAVDEDGFETVKRKGKGRKKKR